MIVQVLPEIVILLVISWLSPVVAPASVEVDFSSIGVSIYFFIFSVISLFLASRIVIFSRIPCCSFAWKIFFGWSLLVQHLCFCALCFACSLTFQLPLCLYFFLGLVFLCFLNSLLLSSFLLFSLVFLSIAFS